MLFVDPVNGDVCVPWSLECADGGAEAIFAWPLGPQYNGLMGALDGMTGQITGSAEDPGQTRDQHVHAAATLNIGLFGDLNLLVLSFSPSLKMASNFFDFNQTPYITDHIFTAT